MKRLFTVIGFILSCSYSFSQNLVENPSFEITTSNCTGIMESFPDIVNWDQANVPGADSCSTADFFSACNFSIMGIGGLSVPGSQMGFQYSHTGSKHIGLITHEAGSGWREYAQGRTSTPLIAGQSYCVSMYVSLANACLFATNNIGVKFYQNHFQRNACPGNTNSLITNPSLNYDCAPITDTLNWTRIQWNYVATGGEQYFVIGNFFDNANTSIANVPNSGGGLSLPIPMAYYFIDDVSIVPNACCYVDLDTAGTSVFCVNDVNAILTTTVPQEGNCTPANLVGVWAGPGIVDALAGNFSPSQAGVGNHTITYTLPCGYVATRQIVVSPCQPLTVCQSNGNVTVSNGVAPYNWQSQVTTQDCSGCLPAVPPFIAACSMPPGCAVTTTAWQTFATGTSVPAPTTFPVRVIDAAGTVFIINNIGSLPPCAACPTITVTSSGVTNATCAISSNGSATVSASGGATPYTYTWTPGNLTGATQNALAPGTYTVTAADNNSCTGTTTITITGPPALSLQTSSVAPDCGASNGSATVAVTGGSPGYSYSWSPSGGNAATASNLAAGSYTVTVTDANNCTANAQVSLSNANGPVVSLISQTDVSCNGQSNGEAEISVAQGTAPYTISWSPSGGNTATASNLSAGNYVATVTDAAGCIATQNVTIVEPSAIQANVAAQPANCGTNDGSAAVIVSGGTAPYSYTWSPSGGTGAAAIGLAGGNYTVTVTDASNCVATAPVTVNVVGVDSSLVITTQATDETCAGNDGAASVQVTGGTPPYTYSWSSGVTPDSASISGLTPGTYTITVSDQCYSISKDVVVDSDITLPTSSFPNIITPNGDGVNDVYDLGTQFESTDNFYCVIYNRWGVAVHKTSHKSILWKPKNITDGTYFILVSYNDCTGKEGKLTGTVTVSGSKL